MKIYLKLVGYLYALFMFSAVHAGSYEDWFIAIRQDDPASVTALLARGFDANSVDPKGVHGLYIALQEGSPRVAEVLIEFPKTRIEWRTPQDESPLMMAALKGHTELVRKLVARDADVNKPGWAPLHYAATGGHLKIMELLLEHHAFIDAQSPNGSTPLMMAAHYGTPEAVKLLLDAGADVHMKNHLGLTALDAARRGNRKDSEALILAALRRPRR
ncbi:MAG: ankyrin repeat domain-containing protein [Burkholderiales bacterium]|nr:ankyrin repeat domain-containing protein [Burkholderiales bacterium]